jgi:hypothetical protein
MVAAAVVAVLALGAGLIIAVARTDGDRSPAAKPEQADASVLGINGGVLPARVEAGSSVADDARPSVASYRGRTPRSVGVRGKGSTPLAPERM